jgi:hypothetical protein
METVEGNEVIARFLGAVIPSGKTLTSFLPNIEFCSAIEVQTKNGEYLFRPKDLKFHRSYDWLLPAWVKFRDLKLNDEDDQERHDALIDRVGRKILYAPISEAFTELVSALKWYESLKKVKEL